MMPKPKMVACPKCRAAEDGHLVDQIVRASASAALGVEERRQLGMVEDRQRNVRSHAKNRQEEQREEDLPPQLGDGENNADFFPHGVFRLTWAGKG